VKLQQLAHQFVETIPADLEEGQLYVSTRFRTVVHLCACGCKSKIVTPIRPDQWTLAFNGETVSLWPSIGNWQTPCRSHYVIKENRVEWARPWTKAQVLAGRERDERAVDRYYASRSNGEDTPGEKMPEPPTRLAVLTRVLRRLRGR
jgi:hypothetical protein